MARFKETELMGLDDNGLIFVYMFLYFRSIPIL